MTPLDSAIYWFLQGFATIPIKFRDKRPLLSSWKEFQMRLPTETELFNWFYDQQVNIALITGWNNLAVIDFDNEDVFLAWHILFPLQTHMVKTGRGVHVYFKVIEPVKNQHTEFIDIKANGGYIIIPPSVHPNGQNYQVLYDYPIHLVNKITDVLPEQLLAIPPAQPQPVVPSIVPSVWDSIENPFTYQDDLIAKIHRNYKIETFFPDAIKTGSHWLLTLCPFHDDHHPSFWIDTQKQLCGCYTGCTPKPLDIVNFIARLHGFSNREAIIYLSSHTE